MLRIKIKTPPQTNSNRKSKIEYKNLSILLFQSFHNTEATDKLTHVMTSRIRFVGPLEIEGTDAKL